MEVIRGLNLLIAFLTELFALAALGYWGFRTGGPMLVKLLLGLGTPLAAAVIWGAFIAPKASIALPEPVRLLLMAVVFGSAVAALYASGHPKTAIAFGVVIVVNQLLMVVWNQ